jgi:uncharacterized protein (TIGR02147 family)
LGFYKPPSEFAMKPDIFTYLEYRSFLKDAFEFVKVAAPKLSYRTFAKRSGFSSPNFFQLVVQGKRNLSSANVVLVAKAFKLNKQEMDFFQNLVGYDQSQNVDEKNLYYQRILRNKHNTAIKSLDRSQYEFFSHWYIPVVREMLAHSLFNGESTWIAERIYPRITASQVESAKSIVLKMGLVQQNPASGKWTLIDAVIATDSEPSHLALRNYHMSAIQLAHDSLKAFSQKERDIRSVTIGLSKSAFVELKSRMEKVWLEILDFAGAQHEVENVYQVNLQLFPLTRERKAKDE